MFGSKKVIGLDIGASTIKIAEIEHGRAGPQLKSFGFLPTPKGAIGGGDFTDPIGISESVRTLHQQLKCKSKDMVIGMWGTAVIVKKISMPRVEKKMIAQQVRWEAEQYMPFDPSEVSLSYHLLPSSASSEVMELILVAAQNSAISEYHQVVTGAGLNLKILDVSGFALANTFEANYGRIAGQTVALLNIGANVTNFVAVHEGEVFLSRDIPFGGGNYTNEIHKEMGITLPEAEALKLSAVTGNEVPEQVHTIINSINDNMVEEIRNSFDFFAASNPGLTIARCFYTGGASAMPNFISGASQILNIQFTPINPFAKIGPGPGMSPSYLQQITPFASIVVGLALRKVGDT